MFSLQKLLGQEDKIFGLLESSAEEVCKSAQSLVRLSQDLQNPAHRDDLAWARQTDRRIAEQIGTAIYSSFVTALEREDIEALSSALYKITKSIEKFAERACVSPEQVRDIDFSGQFLVIQRATEFVLELVRSLRGGMNPPKIKALNDQLRLLEKEADQHLITLYKDLFSGSHNPLQVLLLKDLYELLEKTIDRCCDVGNVIAHIVLKHS